MIKSNRLLFASVALMLIFAMPGMTNLLTNIYAASSVSELLDRYLDVLPILGDADPQREPTPLASPQSYRSASLTADPTAGCSESKIIGIGASGHDGNVPQNTVDKNYNTRWSDFGKGKYIQYELEPNRIVCAIDIAWHRGDVRTSDFTVSASNDSSSNFVNVFSSKSSGKTNFFERYVIEDSDLKAKYIRITVNGNTENAWASITEVQMLSKPASPGPNPDPDPDPDPAPGDKDVFGIKKIYKDKPNGEKWFVNMANPESDGRFDPKTDIRKNSDGSWKVTDSQVRMNVFTSTGYDQDEIETYDQEEMASKGYMQSPNDWKNVEITGYIKINDAEDDEFDLTWYARGARHTADLPCEGTAYKGSLVINGETRFAKEQWHPGGYSFQPYQKPVSSIEDKWVGFKVIMFNTEINGKLAVKMENWIDFRNDGDWKKIYGYTDSGGWGEDGDRCGGSEDQIISWGGPTVTFRWDGTSNVDFKNLSVREISTS